jgi:hypothetical protein
MPLLRYLLIASCFGLFACVAGMVLYDIYLAYELDRLLFRTEKQPNDFGVNPIRPIALEMRLRPAPGKSDPKRVQTLTVPIESEFFVDNDGFKSAITSDSGGPLTRP